MSDNTKYRRKTTMRIRNSIFMAAAILSMIPSGAGGAWQGPKLNIVGDNVPVGNILLWIENQSGYTFAYNKSTFDAKRPVTVNAVQADIRDVLDLVFRDSGFAYSVQGNHVILFPKEDAAVSGDTKQQAASVAALPAAMAAVRPQPQVRPQSAANVESENRDTAIIFAESGNTVETPVVEIPEGIAQKAEAGVPAITGPAPEPALVPVAVPALRLPNVPESPRWAVKTNLLFNATTTMNLGVEVRISPKYTIELTGSYNPWSWPDNRKWKSIIVQPEFRYWVFDPFAGHFIGVHMHWAHYNFGNLPFGSLKDNRYQGDLYGAGFSYGYSWYLGKRWALEATLGAGYAYMEYQKFDRTVCGTCFGWESKHYIGVTKLGLNLSFLIK